MACRCFCRLASFCSAQSRLLLLTLEDCHHTSCKPSAHTSGKRCNQLPFLSPEFIHKQVDLRIIHFAEFSSHVAGDVRASMTGTVPTV
jgi:hypothetical protein